MLFSTCKGAKGSAKGTAAGRLSSSSSDGLTARFLPKPGGSDRIALGGGRTAALGRFEPPRGEAALPPLTAAWLFEAAAPPGCWAAPVFCCGEARGGGETRSTRAGASISSAGGLCGAASGGAASAAAGALRVRFCGAQRAAACGCPAAAAASPPRRTARSDLGLLRFRAGIAVLLLGAMLDSLCFWKRSFDGHNELIGIK